MPGRINVYQWQGVAQTDSYQTYLVSMLTAGSPTYTNLPGGAVSVVARLVAGSLTASSAHLQLCLRAMAGQCT